MDSANERATIPTRETARITAREQRVAGPRRRDAARGSLTTVTPRPWTPVDPESLRGGDEP